MSKIFILKSIRKALDIFFEEHRIEEYRYGSIDELLNDVEKKWGMNHLHSLGGIAKKCFMKMLLNDYKYYRSLLNLEQMEDKKENDLIVFFEHIYKDTLTKYFLKELEYFEMAAFFKSQS